LRLHDSGSQGGFAMVNVTDSADVDMRFRSLKLLFSHCSLLVFVMSISVL
jgi:hypothetical protein